MSNNNDLDPAASTQMFRAFVDGQTPNSPTPAAAPAARGNDNLGKIAYVVVGAVVLALIIYFVA